MGTPTTAITSTIRPSIPTIYYCDPGDVQRLLTVEGVQLKIEDYGQGSVSGEISALEDAIWEASEEINFYLFTHYDPAQLVKSTWVNRTCTVLAAYFLSLRRANDPPAALSLRYKYAISKLEQLHKAEHELPGIPLRATAAPSYSNIRIDQRYPTYRARVETTISEKTPASYPQSVDYTSLQDYVI